MHYKVKARKNFVLDCVELDQIWKACEQYKGQVNYTLVKSELGKVRLAVAGDLPTYLMMTWVTSLLQGAYKQWPGNTLEESVSEQTDRMCRMLKLCSICFGLPYDYKGFEKQPTTDELRVLFKFVLRNARKALPANLSVTDFDSVADRILMVLDRDVLVARFDEVIKKFNVTGGLMSGLRWTSMIGNAWNTVMTQICLDLLVGLGISAYDIERYIRGDDSAIFSPDPQKLS